jgi:dUTP pyrophosphatase
MKMLVKRVSDTAIMPTRAKAGDAGLDFYADEPMVLDQLERHTFDTGIAVQLPPGTVGYITPRSGLAHKFCATVLNGPGTVDQGYRGQVKINLINTDPQPLVIAVGDRIGQMVIHWFLTPELVEVDELEPSERGDGGHGSTGK